MSSEIQDIKNIISTREWTSMHKRFASSIRRTTAFALGNVDDMLSYSPLNPGESIASFQAKPKGYRLIVQRILQSYMDGISGLPVSRKAPNFPLYDLYPIVENLHLQRIQMTVEIAGTAAVLPIWNGEEIRYKIYDATQLIPVVQNDKLYALGVYEDDAEKEITIWTPWSITYLKDGAETSIPNPYQIIPFAIYRAAIDPNSWYGYSELASYVPNNIAVNKMLTDLQQLARDQSYSQLVYKGPEITSNDPENRDGALRIKTGPDQILHIDTTADLFTVTPDASIAEINEAADSLAQKTYEDAAIDSMIAAQGSESSGFALKIKRTPYLNKMRGKRTLFEEADEFLVEMAVLLKEVGVTGIGGSLSPDFTIETEFDDSVLSPETATEDQADGTYALEKGLASRIDLIQERYNVDRPTAIEMAARIDQDAAIGSKNGL